MGLTPTTNSLSGFKKINSEDKKNISFMGTKKVDYGTTFFLIF
jgi:hypothetical protein